MKQFKNITILYLLVTLTTIAQPSGLIPKFDLKPNNITLTRTAQPNQYMDKIGRKAALMGFENGSFEMWIWPWKVLRNFDIQFFVGTTTQPILSKDIVRDISVTPEATTITFVYESFTVKEIIFVTHDEQGAIILLDVHTNVPLTIVSGFIPVMQPQWPAGIGGQYSFWNDDEKAYVISESQRRAAFVCGSPAGEKMMTPPAHMFADSQIQFRISIQSGETENNFIPIVIAGGQGISRDSVYSLYKNLYTNPQKYYEENYNFYQNLSSSTIKVNTPDEKLNLAFEWGKAALNNLMVENPNLGKGLVAGYGLSGGGGRPGFAWYFGGDAFINCLAMNSFGDYESVRDALSFTQKWQRRDDFPIRKKSKNKINNDIGKMAHELSQSDGFVDWWNDYHYGYNHADTTPWYLVAIGDYLRKTGDIDFIKKSWKSIKQAYEWCKRKDSNGDSLMDLKGAGLGVLEFGSLVKIFNDMYTQGLWTQGIKEVNNIAKFLGEENIANESEKLFQRAQSALEKIYWIDDLKFYSFGAAEDGTQVRDKNIYSSATIMFDLLNKENCESTIAQFNESDMVTDWGVRNLSTKSSLYEPTNYNYGTVWPFTSYFIGTAQYKYHFNLQGYQTLQNTLQHAFDYGLGIVPEVFSGDINTKLAEAYHDQGFCTSGYIYPLIHGMLGLDVDGLNHKITFSPKIPIDWNFLDVINIAVGKNKIDFYLKKSDGIFELGINKTGDEQIEIELSPDFSLGTEIHSVQLNKSPVNFEVIKHSQAYQLKTNFILNYDAIITIDYTPSVELYLLQEMTPVGATNERLKIISQKLEGNVLSITTEILPNKEYKLGVMNEDRIESITGASLMEGKLIISEKEKGNEFINHIITIKIND